MCCNNACEGLTDTLCMIVKLQKQGESIDDFNMSCDRPFLGVNSNNVLNTRPISFYTCPNNTLWTMPYTSDEGDGISTVFRAEAVEDCCLTCRVLRPTTEGSYDATNSFFTINLNCIGALQCLDDIFISCL